MKNFLKLAVSIVLCIATVNLVAESFTLTLTANMGTNNVIPPTGGAVKITGVSLSSDSTATGIKIFDSATLPTVRTNAAYQTITATVGNITNIWTNYFGAINTNTWVGPVYTTNSVSAATNAIPPTITMSGTASGTVAISDVSYMFHTGVSISNTTANTGSVTIQYQR